MVSTKATKAITIEADSKSATTIEDGAVITEASDLQSTNEVREINQPLFRAVGIGKAIAQKSQNFRIDEDEVSGKIQKYSRYRPS